MTLSFFLPKSRHRHSFGQTTSFFSVIWCSRLFADRVWHGRCLCNELRSPLGADSLAPHCKAPLELEAWRRVLGCELAGPHDRPVRYQVCLRGLRCCCPRRVDHIGGNLLPSPSARSLILADSLPSANSSVWLKLTSVAMDGANQRHE